MNLAINRALYVGECGTVAEKSKVKESTQCVDTSNDEDDSQLQTLSKGNQSEYAASSSKAPLQSRLRNNDALIEILDGTILLYHISAHKQLSKVNLNSLKSVFQLKLVFQQNEW